MEKTPSKIVKDKYEFQLAIYVGENFKFDLLFLLYNYIFINFLI